MGAITEDDWIRPLVLLREVASEAGVTLSADQEQTICRQVVEAVTAAIADEVQQIAADREAQLAATTTLNA